jgi:predicted glycoside hydrolase/deacetylase ChbG (UPF0249 family)
MGGSAGKAVDKVTKETSGALKRSTGGAVDLGSTDIQSQAENFADESGLQAATDNLVATADTITKPITDPIKKFGGDVANMMGLPGSLDEMMNQASGMVDKTAAKQMSQRVGLGQLGQNMRQQAKQKFGRGQTARTLITGKY